MNATIALRMTGADFLKLRKKRGTVIWSLLLALAPVLLMFIVKAIQHSSNAAEHGPAGGISSYHDGLRILAEFFGPLAAIMIGTDGGAGDVGAGVFRDLVVTGRSRVALFAVRVPAALALTWLVAVFSFAILALGTFALAAGAPTPSGSEVVDGLGFTILATGVICAVAVGFASLTASRPAALTALIGWHLIASPILANIGSLGSSRKALLSQAVDYFSPAGLTDGGGRGGHGGHGPGGATVTLSGGVATVVVIVWVVAFLALGAWRTRTMDA